VQRGPFVTVRVRVCLPLPHLAEHADHDNQSLVRQTGGGHTWVLQSCVSVNTGQAAPK